MELNTAIDRNSYVPLYAQVRDALRDGIEQGGLKPGEQLPGEPELCRMFDVSRTVIRQALRDIELEGIIFRQKGRGTFVAEPKLREGLFQELTGFYEDMTNKGYAPISQVLTQEVVSASRKVASYLKLRPGTPVIQIDRLRFVDDEPIVLVTTYLPEVRCPGLATADLSHQSLYGYLSREYGLAIERGHRYLEAVPAGEHEAKLLQVKKGAPLILLDSVSYLADGSPIEYYHALHRGDRSRFEVELIRVPAHSPARDDSVRLAIQRAQTTTAH
ncbi:MAG: GntR family transcriptional regulator [Chloroflexota bacterium]